MLQARFHHQRQPQQGEEVGAGAERGVVWKQGESGPQPGLTDAGLVRSKDSGRVRCTHGHMYVYTRELRHMGVPLQEVATVLVSATPHTGPGTEESKKNVD